MASFYTQEKLVKLRELIAEHQSAGWEQAWLTDITPWDGGRTEPPLEELFTSGEVALPSAGRALVPGCGKGFDALAIAKHLGLHVTALDISPTALALANGLLDAQPPALRALVSFEERDFFALPDAPTFALVSDYTFFQALPPAVRPAWGAKMRAVVQPGGLLVVLAYPTDAPQDVGPPFAVAADTHAAVLGAGWAPVLDRVPAASSAGHVGRDRLLVFRRL